jgi:hypothetical protein
MVAVLGPYEALPYYIHTYLGILVKHNRSDMVAVLGPYEALPYYIHAYIGILARPLLLMKYNELFQILNDTQFFICGHRMRTVTIYRENGNVPSGFTIRGKLFE